MDTSFNINSINTSLVELWRYQKENNYDRMKQRRKKKKKDNIGDFNSRSNIWGKGIQQQNKLGQLITGGYNK